MRVFVPMPDEWTDGSAFVRERLVPYRCGMAFTIELNPDATAPAGAPRLSPGPIEAATDPSSTDSGPDPVRRAA